MDAGQICDLLDNDLVQFIHNIITILKISVPIILVILGMLDFAKGVTAGTEDEIKKGQKIFIKRLIAGFLVFFVVSIVQLVMALVSPDDDSIWNCANQILNGTAGDKYNYEDQTGGGNTGNTGTETSTGNTGTETPTGNTGTETSTGNTGTETPTGNNGDNGDTGNNTVPGGHGGAGGSW